MNIQATRRRIESSLRLRSMRVLGRSQVVRALFRGLLPPPRDVASEIFPEASLARVVTDLRRDGIAFGLDLPPALVEEILGWEKTEPRYAERDLRLGFHESDRGRAEAVVGKKFSLASLVSSGRCEAIQRVRRDPLLAAVAEQYLGARARLISSTLWWSYPTPASEEVKSQSAQLFHYDLDDFGFLKFFFYLTDVDEEAGPHVFVRGTHRRKSLSHLLHMQRYTDEDIATSYGAHRAVSVVGPSGSGFAEDTFGIHKGTPPARKPRLLLQLLFAQYFYGWEDDEPHGAAPQMIPLDGAR